MDKGQFPLEGCFEILLLFKLRLKLDYFMLALLKERSESFLVHVSIHVGSKRRWLLVRIFGRVAEDNLRSEAIFETIIHVENQVHRIPFMNLDG